ncbi:DUF2637 domain-containing protein [Streptomyces sp. NPDC001404]|uniref:DUF2637 domain-containing protein n=1 Tax=Streptomyces sp. NPDC001404 TaxID=3364571 RepID=UPI0036AB357A
MINVNLAEFGKIKTRFVWWGSIALIGGAAAGVTAWSLYVIAHDRYGVPSLLAAGTAAVFDGTAMACLYLAGQAIRERRSALGPHLATVGLAAVSIYLNRLHADLIRGGRGAFVLFAAPTVALLILAGLSWSAQRARLRAQDGDVPATLPKLGFWAWLLATDEAWKRTKDEVEAHVSGTDKVRTPSGQAPAKPRTATDALRAHFAKLDPTEAIRLAHSARTDAPPAELAAELALYGVHVSAVQVALVLGYRPPTTTVSRADTDRTSADPAPGSGPPVSLTGTDTPMSPPETAAEAARRLISLGFTDKAQAVPLIMNTLSLENTKRQWDSVRRAFERERDRVTPPPPEPPAKQLALDTDDGVGQGGGGYV